MPFPPAARQWKAMHSTTFPVPLARRLALRWTIGDVARRGFDALRLSLWGAWRVFGAAATYLVCVNTLGLDEARQRTGPVPPDIAWRRSTRDQLPDFLLRAFGAELASGMGWKLAPLRLFPAHYELSLDNDCILWDCPPSVRDWLETRGAAGACIMAEDVIPCYAQFAPECPRSGVNAGLRGVPPGFDLAGALQEAIATREAASGGALHLQADDEQGLQVAALSRGMPLSVVALRELSVCSPFHPHLPWLGECGAHFVGINARHIPWNYYDRPADAWLAEHWARQLPELVRRTGAPGFEDRLAESRELAVAGAAP
jgi:hypothetical protein